MLLYKQKSMGFSILIFSLNYMWFIYVIDDQWQSFNTLRPQVVMSVGFFPLLDVGECLWTATFLGIN